MPIHVSRLSARDEMFSFVPHDGEPLHFATTRMVVYLRTSGYPVENVELTEELARHVAQKHGVEPGHLANTLERINEPCVLLDWGDGTHVVADGNHRVVARYMMQLPTLPAWLLPEKVWRRFVIEGVPSTPAEAARFQRQYPHFKRWFFQRNGA